MRRLIAASLLSIALLCPAHAQDVGIKGALEDNTEAVKRNTEALKSIAEALSKIQPNQKTPFTANPNPPIQCGQVVGGPTCEQTATAYCNKLGYGTASINGIVNTPGGLIGTITQIHSIICS